MEDPRLWSFIADMNGSGAVTISDVWLWFKWLFFYPGDFVISLIIEHAPGFARFFEMSYKSSYSGALSGMLSALFWVTVVLVIEAESSGSSEPVETRK